MAITLLPVRSFVRFFGFAKRGRSVLGARLSKVAVVARLHRVTTVGLVSIVLVSAVYAHWSLAANVGGLPTINITPQQALRVDTATRITVRLPVKTLYISRGFSWFHSGVDLVAEVGTPVYPLMDGVVNYTENGWLGYGHHVIIDHGAGLTTLYGHLSQIEVRQGQRVTVSDEIGRSGSTGFSTGPHLHLELRQDGHAIDPADLLPEVTSR